MMRVVDVSRAEPFTDDPNDHRELLLHIWYPAAAAAGETAPYVEGIGDDEAFRATYKFVGLERLRVVRSHASADAQLSSARKRYPVILFSHGLGMVSTARCWRTSLAKATSSSASSIRTLPRTFSSRTATSSSAPRGGNSSAPARPRSKRP